MSIGLNDLNKKRKVSTAAPSTPSKDARPTNSSEIPTVSQASESSTKIKSVYRKSITARPWTESGASKAPKSSRPRGATRAATSDLSINEEWMSLQTEPIFWIDFREHSSLLKLNESLSQIEAKIDDVVFAPIRALKSFFKSQK